MSAAGAVPAFLRSPGFWGGYLAMLVLLATVLWLVRTQTLASLDNPQAAANWQDWERIKRERQDAEAAAHPGIQPRRRPPSPESPHVVILRDYFPGVVASLSIVATAFYVFLWNVVRGVLTSKTRIDLEPQDTPAG